jgi:hypothetical protein
VAYIGQTHLWSVTDSFELPLGSSARAMKIFAGPAPDMPDRPGTQRLGRIQSLVLEEELALSWPARSRVVPIWFWRRVDDQTAHVHGVKVKIHEQQRDKELDIESR